MTIQRLLLSLICFLSFQTIACSMMPAFEPFAASGENSAEPVPPTFEVASIKRGKFDDLRGSCSGFGHIVLTLASPPTRAQGYTFEIVKGSFEAPLFTDNPIMVAELLEDKNTFYFTWFDGNSNQQSPFDFTVKITAVSQAGMVSEPQYLRVTHPGVHH